jgi:hypothetical protein
LAACSRRDTNRADADTGNQAQVSAEVRESPESLQADDQRQTGTRATSGEVPESGGETAPERLLPFTMQTYANRLWAAIYAENALERLMALKNELEKRYAFLGGVPKDLMEPVTRAMDIVTGRSRDLWKRHQRDLAFRRLTSKDTTVTHLIDYTGDGRDEIHAITVRKAGNEIWVDNMVISEGDTIKHTSQPYIGFSELPWPFEELSVSYEQAVRYMTGVSRGRVNVFSTPPDDMVNDVARLTGKPRDVVRPQVIEYLQKFQGNVYSSRDEIGGIAMIWYEPLKSFVVLFKP